jgi:acyl-CoA reductase-like NAD-dependent aldehyde dehydrogenase
MNNEHAQDQIAQDRMARARAAQARWGRLTVRQRVCALRPLRHAIAERMDEIVQTIADEVGKPPMDALAGDVVVALEHLLFCERHAARELRRQRRGQPWFLFSGTRFAEVWEPHGIVLVFAPWNYPLQLSVVPMATALFAGNAVLLKCSEYAPRTARLVEELCLAAGLPEGLVQVSCEAPDGAAALIVTRPDLIFFTGSSHNGGIVAAKAAELMVPAVMELGGKDAALVFASCKLERTVSGLVYGGFSNAGQACVCAKRIYVEKNIFDDFLRLFLEKAARLRTGTEIESDIGAVKLDSVRQSLREQIADAVARGATVHRAGGGQGGDCAPVVLTGVPHDARLMVEDTFGPVVCIAPFADEADGIALANASQFALGASVWTDDSEQGQRVAGQLQCGSCTVNDVIRSIGNPHAAFGGNKLSGYGRYHGVEGLRTFSRAKTVMTATRLHSTEIHWFPFRAHTFRRVRSLLRLRHGARLIDRIKAITGLWMLLLALGPIAHGRASHRSPCIGDAAAAILLVIPSPQRPKRPAVRPN